MSLQPDAAAIRQHFATLYDGTADGYAVIWNSASKRTDWVPVADLEAIVATVIRQGQIGNVYAGVGLHAAPRDETSRGAAGDVFAIPGLWAELDIAGDGHSQCDLPPNTAAIARLVRESLPSPSYGIHSGGGVHLYWLFKEPWIFADADERDHAARLERALQWRLIAGGRAQGWRFDNTSDLSRVLRPAGTINRKPGLPERSVRVIVAKGPRYGIEELERFLPLDDPLFPPAAIARGVRSNAGPQRRAAALWSRIVGTGGCAYLRHCVEDAATLSEPEWHAAMTVIGRCHNGETIAHQVSKAYPLYDPSETQTKFDYAAARDNPIRCETIRWQRGGEPWCATCLLRGRIASPIMLGYPPGYRLERATATAGTEAGR